MQLINEPVGIEAPLAARIDTTVQPTTRPTDQDGLSEAKLVPVIACYLHCSNLPNQFANPSQYNGQPQYRLMVGLTEVSVLYKFELNNFPNES